MSAENVVYQNKVFVGNLILFSNNFSAISWQTVAIDFATQAKDATERMLR